MADETAGAKPSDQRVQPDALSNDILKLKIDDLFQEFENLKLRVARLEAQALLGTAAPVPEVVSNPDRSSTP
jgi:hypothetical protein